MTGQLLGLAIGGQRAPDVAVDSGIGDAEGLPGIR